LNRHIHSPTVGFAARWNQPQSSPFSQEKRCAWTGRLGNYPLTTKARFRYNLGDVPVPMFNLILAQISERAE
jgi:hypothetical protein